MRLTKWNWHPVTVVAKAIEDEIAAGRGFGSGLNAYVVADLVT